MNAENEYFERTEFTADHATVARQMFSDPRGLPQDKLVWASYHFVGKYGLSLEFLWASGRQDAHCTLDVTEEMIALNRPNWKQSIKPYLAAREHLRQTLRKEQAQQRDHYDDAGQGRAGESRCSAPV